MTLAWSAFVLGAAISLATSWLLVTRLERLGARFGLSEALLGVVAALAADAPEITSAVTALAHHQRSVGAGVVIGSNIFNLAALLGLGAVVTGVVSLHRRVILLGGAVAVWIALCTLAVTCGLIAVGAGLALAGGVLAVYVVVLGLPHARLAGRGPRHWRTWIVRAVEEEEIELEEAIQPRRGQPVDALVAVVALVVVVVASVAMEQGATTLGHHFRVSNAVIGGVVLAIVTSLPNAVAAVHLATRGRGAAALSTALNSNNVNAVAGLLVPGLFLGLATRSAAGTLTAGWYVGLTVLTLALAYRGRGLRRMSGAVIIGGYVVFVAVLVALT